jgi:hypothetical protein
MPVIKLTTRFDPLSGQVHLDLDRVALALAPVEFVALVERMRVAVAGAGPGEQVRLGGEGWEIRFSRPQAARVLEYLELIQRSFRM